MREYKFRGKRIDTGGWAYGDFYFFEGANIRHCHQTCHPDEGLQNAFTDYEVMPETIGQFTGLRDKNGNEIYEGDIVLWDGFKAIIEWLPRMAGYYAMWKGEGVHFHDMQQIVPAHGGLRHIEIIGSIHDQLNLPADSPALNTMNIYDPKEQPEEEVKAPATETEQEQVQGEATQEETEG